MTTPSFPVATLTIWNQYPDHTIVSQLSAKSDQLATNNKTDSLPSIVKTDPNIMTVTRYWADAATANEWIAFVQGLNGPLQSISIVS